MCKKILVLLLVLTLSLSVIACQQEEATLTATPTLTVENTNAPTDAPTDAPTPTPTPMPTIYGEDLIIYDNTYTYETLKAFFEQYIVTNEFTYGTPPYMTYDMRHIFKQVSILGYYTNDRHIFDQAGLAGVEALRLTESDSFEDDNNEKLQSFQLDFNIKYKTANFVKTAITRDIAKTEAFVGSKVMYISLDGKYYNSIADIPQETLNSFCEGKLDGSLHLTFDKKVSVSMRIWTEDNEKVFNSSFRCDYT